MMLDHVDKKLLSLLQLDGRLTNAELANAVDLSQSACHRRVKRLEANGVIEGYSAIVNRQNIGLSVLVYVSIKLENHSETLLTKFTQHIESLNEIIACHAISGDGDYLLKVATTDMDAYAEFALKRLVRIPGVKESKSNFVMSTIIRKEKWPS